MDQNHFKRYSAVLPGVPGVAPGRPPVCSSAGELGLLENEKRNFRTQVLKESYWVWKGHLQKNHKMLHAACLESSTPGTNSPLMCSFSSPKPRKRCTKRTIRSPSPFILRLIDSQCPVLLPAALAGSTEYRRVLENCKFAIGRIRTSRRNFWVVVLCNQHRFPITV